MNIKNLFGKDTNKVVERYLLNIDALRYDGIYARLHRL